jgi:hypothetical protein
MFHNTNHNVLKLNCTQLAGNRGETDTSFAFLSIETASIKPTAPFITESYFLLI